MAVDPGKGTQKGLLARSRMNLTFTEKARLIDSTQWANQFSFTQLKKLAAYLDVYQVPAKTLLFYEGDKNPYLVLIARGSVHVVKFASSGTARRIATLGPGRTIGEMGIIDGEPRSASAVTGTEATLLVMTAENFARLNRELPGMGIQLVLKIAKIMSQHLRETSGRLIELMGG